MQPIALPPSSPIAGLLPPARVRSAEADATSFASALAEAAPPAPLIPPSAAPTCAEAQERAMAHAIRLANTSDDMDTLRTGGCIQRDGVTFTLAPHGRDKTGQANAFRIIMSGGGIRPIGYTLPTAPVGITAALNSMGGEQPPPPERLERLRRMEALPGIGLQFGLIKPRNYGLMPLMTPEVERDLRALSAAAVAAGWSNELARFKLTRYFGCEPAYSGGESVQSLLNDKPIVEQDFSLDEGVPDPPNALRRILGGLTRLLTDPGVSHIRVVGAPALFAVCDGDRYAAGDAAGDYDPHRISGDLSDDLHIRRPAGRDGSYLVSQQKDRGRHLYRLPGAAPEAPWTPVPVGSSVALPPGSVLHLIVGGNNQTPVEVRLPELDAAGQPMRGATVATLGEQARRIEQIRRDPVMGGAFHVYRPDVHNIPASAVADVQRLAEAAVAEGWSERLKAFKAVKYLRGEPVEDLLHDRPVREFEVPRHPGPERDAVVQRIADAAKPLLQDGTVSGVRIAFRLEGRLADRESAAVCDSGRYDKADYLKHAWLDLQIIKPSEWMPGYQVALLSDAPTVRYRLPNAPPEAEPIRLQGHTGLTLPGGAILLLPTSSYHGAAEVEVELPRTHRPDDQAIAPN